MYVQEQVKKKQSHPYLIETLADFTSDNLKAIQLYRKALRLARKWKTERHTILLELAKRYSAIKNQSGLTWRYLNSSIEEARIRKDRDVLSEAMKFAKKINKAASKATNTGGSI